jgi:negative regulator of sigma E activity
MTTKQEGMNSAHTTTTEELIVQYLDGELVRKELETVLFDRISHSEEARALLREYLVVRGAIRQSRADERFQLSSDLDARTRSRIEQMFETIEAGGFDIASVDENGFLADQPAIASSPASRRLKQWSLRPSYAMLALLLAIGTTWFLTRTTTENKGAKQIAQTHVTNTPSEEMAAASTSNATPEVIAKPEVLHSERNSRMPLSHTVVKPARSAPSLAQSAPHPAASAPPVAQPDPADIMLSHRYAKAIEAASKHEVVISGRDRL